MLLKKIIISLMALSMTVETFAQKWSPVGENIKTPWGTVVDPSNPLPEYPRPQMVRENWLNLNGLWNYAITVESAETFKSEGKVLVPFPVESSLSGVGRRITKDDALWYERTFTIPKAWGEKNILLHFGAVDWQTEVYVNGELVGEHRGGYDPFTFDITQYLEKSGKQTLRVKVMDASDNSLQPRGKQCFINKGIWYTPVSGIWQTVWLEPTRLINPSSGGNYDFSKGVEAFGDILDVHHYPCPAMNVFESKFVNVLGEYGGIGLPVEGHTWDAERKWGYGKTKKDSEELMTQYEEYLDMLKVFVQTGCTAAVYTQTTDVEGEVNGLITYDRKVIKVDMPRIAQANKEVIESMSK